MVLRFRAWNIEQECMINSDNIISFDFEDEILVEQATYGTSDGVITGRDIDEYAFDDVIIMQSTGVFDKNGVEIFEGDVVASTRWDLKDNPYRKAGGIQLINGQYLIVYDIVPNHRREVMEVNGHALSASIEPEIIGNIYEHPELLT